MRFSENLKKGGTIGFVAPSFGCTTEPYKSAFANAQKKWKEMGYQLDLGPNCYAEHGIGISALLPSVRQTHPLRIYATAPCRNHSHTDRKQPPYRRGSAEDT